jgi:Ca-activated chloride channel family protein
MTGTSIEQAREALLLALSRLTPADRFNVIQFNSTTDVLFESARKADAQALEEARNYVRALRATGGTEMAGALEAALGGTRDPEVLRQVIFLTDGAVGNEDQLVRIIHDKLGESRLFTVGIGSAPNSHFMTTAAQFGRGTFTYIGKVDEVKQKMGELFAKLENPVLSGISVQWPQGAKVEMWPPRVPDLYAGEPVMLSARMDAPGGEIAIAGTRGAERWRTTLPLKGGADESGVHVLWARHKIAALMDEIRKGGDAESAKAEVVSVALEHHLVSKYTSLVAVDVTPVRPAGAALKTAAMPTNLPEGWVYEQVAGELPQTATPKAMHALVGTILIVLAALLWLFGRRMRPLCVGGAR